MTASENQAWLERLRGDSAERETAIGELRDLLIRGLTSSMRNRYGGRVQAEDVAQDALLKILDALDSFEGRSRFTTWAMTIANRVAISQLRRKYYQDVSLEMIKANVGEVIELAGFEPAEDGLDKGQILRTLNRLIETILTDRQRLAIRASLEGLPVEEIANRLGSSRNAIYKLVHDARLKLKDGFAQAGILPDDIYTLFA